MMTDDKYVNNTNVLGPVDNIMTTDDATKFTPIPIQDQPNDAGAEKDDFEEGRGRSEDVGAAFQHLPNIPMTHCAVAATVGAPAAPAVAVAAEVAPGIAVAALNFFGITEAALLAPIPPPPKKKRRTQDEFTISQKLEILSELKGPNAPSVPNLAARHNTSRTSIYRWKKDMPRLLRLARKDGKGQYKRVAHKRKLYNEEFTASEKLQVVRKLKGDGAPSVRSMAVRCGANHRSIYRWKKDEARLAKLVEEDGRGGCKRVGGDPLFRVKEALKIFHANNYLDVAAVEQSLSLTGTIVATKARQIRDEMLMQHDLMPFLTEEEVKGMREFTASSSWGRKIIHKFDWKGGNNTATADTATTDTATTDAADTPPTNADSINIDDIASVVRNRKPQQSLPVAASAPTQRKLQKVAAEMKREISSLKKTLNGAESREMKREISSLKKKLNGAESQVRELEVDNAQLRAHLAIVMNGSGDGGCGGEPTVVRTMYDGLNRPMAPGPSRINEEAENAAAPYAVAAEEGGGANEQDFQIGV